jgi:hypothetical protein
VRRAYCNPGGYYPLGEVLDPYNPRTHPDPERVDMFRYQGLARQGYRLMWLLGDLVLREPERLVREAVLEGRDRSPLATQPGVTGRPI